MKTTLKISKVEIKNFQSHKDTTIHFSKFNIIVGSTDSGKSAIIRAIRWCLYNTPSGNSFIRYGKKEASVKIFFDNGKTIHRVKSNKDNYYVLYDKENDDLQRYDNFGRGPIKEVLEFHGMKEVNILKTRQSLNICDQLSAPFFIANTPSEKSKIISDLANIQKIDEILKEVKSEELKNSSEEKVLRSDLVEIENELKKYDKLDKLKLEFENLCSIKDKLNSTIGKKNKIIEIRDHLKRLNESRNKCNKILNNKKIILTSAKIISDLIRMQNQINEIKKIQSNINNCISNKSRYNKILKKINVNNIDNNIKNLNNTIKSKNQIIDLENIIKKINKLKKEKELINKILKEKEKINNIIKKNELTKKDYSFLVLIKNIQNKLMELKTQKNDVKFKIEDLHKKQKEVLKKYQELLKQQKKCPLCLSNITDSVIESIKDKL